MKLACIFPGQGSQSLGMLASILEADPSFLNCFNIAKEVLGVDYWQMLQQGSESEINNTLNTQLIMLIADVAMYQFLLNHGMPKPQYMAGHSLGEYAALVAASALRFEDALLLVQTRARLMQQAVVSVDGAMAAIIGLDDACVEEVCRSIGVAAANFNAPGQVVIAGQEALILEAIKAFELKGARMAKLIPVTVPCHCDLMLPAYEPFKQAILQTDMQLPSIPVVSNVNAAVYTDLAEMKELLAQQLFKPVLWVDSLKYLEQAHVSVLMECGPAKVLSGLAKRTVPNLKTLFCFEYQHRPEWEMLS